MKRSITAAICTLLLTFGNALPASAATSCTVGDAEDCIDQNVLCRAAIVAKQTGALIGTSFYCLCTGGTMKRACAMMPYYSTKKTFGDCDKEMNACFKNVYKSADPVNF